MNAEGTSTGRACKGPLKQPNFPCKVHRTFKSVFVSFGAKLLFSRGSCVLKILSTDALRPLKHLPQTGLSWNKSFHGIGFLMINPFQFSVESALWGILSWLCSSSIRNYLLASHCDAVCLRSWLDPFRFDSGQRVDQKLPCLGSFEAFNMARLVERNQTLLNVKYITRIGF